MLVIVDVVSSEASIPTLSLLFVVFFERLARDVARRRSFSVRDFWSVCLEWQGVSRLVGECDDGLGPEE